MAATPRTKRSNPQAPPRGAKRGSSNPARLPPALQEVTLTVEQAEELERIMARPSTLRPEYAPRPVPDADPSFLD
jgi:hypothetical protein